MNVPIPHQENSFDCGVYILKFAEVMIRNYETLASADDDLKDDGIIPKHVIDDKLEALISSRAFTADDVARQRKHIEETIASDTTQYQLAVSEQKKDPKLTTEAHSKSDEKEAKAGDRDEKKGTETESDENTKGPEEDSKDTAVGDTIEDEEQQTLESKGDQSKVDSKAHKTQGSKEEQEPDTEGDEAGDEKEVSEAETEVVNLDDDDDEEDILLTLEVEDLGNHQAEDGEADHQANEDGDVEC